MDSRSESSNIRLLQQRHVAIPNEHRADEIAAAIHESATWMAPATEVVWDALRMAASRGEPFVVPPMVLVGDPGVGKSRWARHVAGMVGLFCVDMALLHKSLEGFIS